MGKEIKLTGKQIEEFRNALKSAFITFKSLEQMVRFECDKNLRSFVAQGPLDDVTYDLILNAESEGWLLDLLIGARKQNKGNIHLQNVEKSIGISTIEISKGNLEALIRPNDKFINFDTWLTRLNEIEKQVCRIELPSDFGTGFLVSPDILLTNYHVVSKLIDGDVSPSDVILRFDFKNFYPDAQELNGVEIKLATDWYIGHSPHSLEDDLGATGLQSEDELDFALLRLEKPLGRDYIKLPDVSNSDFDKNYQKDKPLFIMQHPKGMPLKFALDTQSTLHLNANNTRLYHRTITEGGSSGSPCFNQDLELIALHHNGFPGFRNIAIPITTLINHWKKESFLLDDGIWISK